ncbi:MAG TPA: transcription antitermination factor NusB, partial [Rhodospirillaceae bacterium]|nr:transcription antitermination factor NusB [Rhodospirillaceae bacterium]
MDQDKSKNVNAAKHLARLVAVQALYQDSYEQDPLDVIVKRMMDAPSSFLNEEDEDEQSDIIQQKPDSELLIAITKGVTENREALTELLKGGLDARFSSERMEVLLRHILLAGAYELHHHSDIDAKIIISDYIDVAHAFYSAKEPALVNAVLDKLSKTLRACHPALDAG